MKQSQRLLLTWLIEDESLFDAVSSYIGPEDFTEEIYRQAAEILFQQHADGEVNPARIVSMFTDEEQQREIAGAVSCADPGGGIRTGSGESPE